MFRLNVEILVNTEKISTVVIEKAASRVTMPDMKISCTKGSPAGDGNADFCYNHIAIAVCDDETLSSTLAGCAAEFVHAILISNTAPKEAALSEGGRICAIVSPDGEPEFLVQQLSQAISGIVNTYLYRMIWAMMQTTLDSSPALVWYKALDGAHFNVNEAFCRTVSRTKEDVEGKKHAYIWNVSEDEAFACQESEETTLREGKTCVFEEPVNTPDGIKTMLTYKSPLRTAKGTVIGTTGIAVDVTQQREYESRLRRMAMTDALTGLLNRRRLYEEAEVRFPGQKTVLYLDIDYFKNINDKYGHEKGDVILKLVSDAMKAEFSDGITARMGGDEFVIVLEGYPSDDEINGRLAKMEKAVAASEEAKGIEVRLAAGIYRGTLPIGDAIKEADGLMYIEKGKHHEEHAK